jgi:hypothetical protein
MNYLNLTKTWLNSSSVLYGMWILQWILVEQLAYVTVGISFKINFDKSQTIPYVPLPSL